MKSVLLALCTAVLAVGIINSGSLVSLVKRLGSEPLSLNADINGHFFGQLTINGVSLKFIVDSGASHVTLNSHDARKANIDYTKGELVSLVTPSGEVQAFSLPLDGLMVGPVILNDVEVTVVEGMSPPYVLLGASAQRRLDVKRDNAIMTLGRVR